VFTIYCSISELFDRGTYLSILTPYELGTSSTAQQASTI